MALVNAYIKESRYPYKSKGPMTPTGICIHNTANDASARNEISYMEGNNNKVSYHIAIDDKEAVVCIPLDRRAYHAGDGDGPGNMSHIGIEICYSLSGGPKFTASEQRAAKETAALLKKYNWGIEKVKKHQDFSGKYCPHRTLDMGWTRFINMVKEALGGAVPDPETPPDDTPDPSKNIELEISTSRDNDELEKCSKLEKIKGVTIYCEPSYFTHDDVEKIAFTDDAVMIIHNNRLSSQNGYHYVIDSGRIDNCVPEDKITKHNEGDATFISRALYDSKPNDCTLSVLITVPHEGTNDYKTTERQAFKLVAYLLVKHGLKITNVFRGFDLSKQASPLHLLEKEKWNAFLLGVENVYKAIAEERYTDSLVNILKTSMTDEEVKDFYYKNQDAKKYAESYQPDHRDIDAIKNWTPPPGEIQNFETTNKTLYTYQIAENISSETHCARNYNTVTGKAESNILEVEPIYPDLIIPPGGTVTLVDKVVDTTTVKNDNVTLSPDEFEKRQKIFSIKDYTTAKKDIKGSPVNNNDPFPVDDKIKELESHMPKVKVDEVNFKLHDTNHPGSVIGQEVTKNFAMVQDEIITVAKRTERRLVRLENTMSTIMRNLWRMSARVQVNCVYYGGQDVYGKYKCIRCLHDDRINDGQSMTMDQCLSCTRYEPVLGQIYAILDETGTNIAQVLDDIQMGYTNMEEYSVFTRVEELAVEKSMANLQEEEKEEPKRFEEIWEEGFKMEWKDQALESQMTHVNEYKTEGIELTRPVLESEFEQIKEPEFEDTRKDGETYEELKFNSDDYTFNGFNSNETPPGNPSNPGDNFGRGATETRNKIVDEAKRILALCQAGKAGYSQAYRNSERNGILYHDCSSLVAACYRTAGLSFGSYTGDQYPLCYNRVGGWMEASSGFDKLIAGDAIFYGNSIPTDPNDLSNVGNITHVALYIGDGNVIEASTGKVELTKQIKQDKWDNDNRTIILARPKCLVDLDKKAEETSPGNSPDGFWNLEYHEFNQTIKDGALKYCTGDVKNFKEYMYKYGYKDALIRISKQHGHDPYMIAALACTESGGNPANRTGGYWGLMQTPKESTKATTSLSDIEYDIDLGCKHLTGKIDALKGKYPGDVVLYIHAYNAGQGTVMEGLSRAGFKYPTGRTVKGGEVADPIAVDAVRRWGQYKYAEVTQYFAKILVRYIEFKKERLFE